MVSIAYMILYLVLSKRAQVSSAFADKTTGALPEHQ